MTQRFHCWVYIWRPHNTESEEYVHPYVHFRVTYNSQTLETTQGAIDRQVDNKAVVPVRNELLLNHKKPQNCNICNCMGELASVMLSETSQRQIPYDSTHVWDLNEQTK